MIDIDSGSVVGTIPNRLGVHGVALATDLGKGFLSDGKAEKVTIFDLKTLKPIADVAAGKKNRRDHFRLRNWTRVRIQWREQQRHRN